MTVVSQNTQPHRAETSPFSLDNDRAYQAWRERKLARYPSSAQALLVDVQDIRSLSTSEKCKLTAICGLCNSVIYRNHTTVTDKQSVRQLGRQLGLERLDENICSDEDGISGLRVMSGGSRHEAYIPYTDKPINWHTDGYYNMPEHRIRAMVLHCVSDAARGGENAMLDHEILYILMRDTDPAMVEALMQQDVMTIPANIENGVLIRDAQSGPVFSVDPYSGNLHMRYTARKRSIEWKADKAVSRACAFMQDIFTHGNEYIFRYRLNPGEGIISNNALHNRSGFVDDESKQRLFYRARYFDRVDATDLNQLYQLGENHVVVK